MSNTYGIICTMQDIFAELSTLKGQYYSDTIEIIEGLPYSQYQIIKQIELYSNDRYLLGNADGQGNEKPFYNITKNALNVAVRATDFDTKDIHIVADNPKDADKSFLLNKEIFNWMDETNFSETLNKMGQTRAKYGGLLIKKFEKNDDLTIDVVDWRNVVTDQIDIDSGAVAERHYMSPLDLERKRGIWDNVDEAIELAQKEQKSGKDSGSSSESTEAKVEVYEIEGEFPRTYIDEEANENEYSLQLWFVVEGGAAKDGEDQLVLFSEEIKDTRYKYVGWEEIPGRGLGRGVVEEGFQAQIWANDATIKERQVMDLASKMIFKTTDDTIENNILTDLDNGDIIKLQEGRDFTPVNTVSNSIPKFDALVEKWQNQFQRATSTFEAVTGETLPSGTPFRLGAMQNQEARSLFDYRREGMGIFLTQVFEDWVLPFILKRINKDHILAADFSIEELRKIDEAFSKHSALKKAIEAAKEGKIVTADEFDQLVKGQQELVKQTKNRRFIDIPKGYFKDIDAKVTVVTTGEERNKRVVLETLGTIMTMVAQNPAITQDPIQAQILSRIIELSGAGLSPISMGLGEKTQEQPQQVPAQQPGQPEAALPTLGQEEPEVA